MINFYLKKCKGFNCKLSNKTTSEFKYFVYGSKLDYTNNEKEVPSLKWNSQYKELLIGASQRIGLLGRSYSFNRNVQQRKVYCSFPV